MRALPALLLCVCLQTVAAEPADEAYQVIERWARAFTESDVDTITGLYAGDALFLGTGSPNVVTDPAGIRAYFENALLNNRPRTASLLSYSARVVNDDVVVFSGLDRVTGVRDGQTFESLGRVTIVVARQDDDWRIVQFHRSALPD